MKAPYYLPNKLLSSNSVNRNTMENALYKPIGELPFPRRLSSSLQGAGIKSVKDLCDCSVDKLMMLPTIGVKSIIMIIDTLQKENLSLKV